MGYGLPMARYYHAAANRLPEFSRDPAQRPFMAKSTAIVFALLVVAISVTCWVKALPEYNKLKQIEAELADVQREEHALEQERRRYELEASALKTNPRYMENRSRDRLHLYRPGESVIKLD